MTEGEVLRRFIVEARALSPQVARWVAGVVWGALPPSRRRAIRDELIREAARRLPPVSAWEKAARIAKLTRSPGPPDATTPAGLVALAVSIFNGAERLDRTLGPAQVFRVIVRFSHSDHEMEVGPVGRWWPTKEADRT